jgi:uncharacterized protein (TIGR03437 family)
MFSQARLIESEICIMKFTCALLLTAAVVCAAAPPIKYNASLGADQGRSLAVNSAGEAYIGTSGQVLKLNASGLPVQFTYTVTPGNVGAMAVDKDGYVVTAVGTTVARNAPNGALVYSITLPGTIYAVAVDANGVAYCAGWQQVNGKFHEVFVARVGTSGSILSSTVFGGSNDDDAYAIAVDSAGNSYVTGQTLSVDFPLKGGVQGGPGDRGFGDAFLVKLAPNGTDVVYSTYVGWSGQDYANAIAVDNTGAVYLVGATSSIDLPTNSKSYQRSKAGGITDAFLAKITPAGDGYSYLTYLGGSDADEAYGVAVDASGAAYVTGQTFSTNFPALDAWQTSPSGAFLTKFAPDGSSVVWSSYLGGSIGRAVAADAAGCVYATGGTFAFKACEPAVVGPVLTVEGIISAASYKGAGAAPGEMLTVYGDGFGPDKLTWYTLTPDGKLPTETAGVRFFFDGVPAPMVWVMKNRASIIAPYSIDGKAATSIYMEADGVRSNTVQLAVLAAKPALYTSNASGLGQAAARNSDNVTLNAQVPAAAGSVVVLYGTGEGQTQPPGVDGLLANSVYPKPVLPVRAFVAGREAVVKYAGAAPTFMAGFLQVNVQIPLDTASGAAEIIVQIGEAQSPAGVTINVK